MTLGIITNLKIKYVRDPTAESCKSQQNRTVSPNNTLKCLHDQKLNVQFGQIKQLCFFPHISPGKKGKKKNHYQVILPVLISFLPKQCSHPCHFHHLRSEPDSWPVTAAAASRWSSSHTASPHCLIAGVHMCSVSLRLLGCCRNTS